MNGLRELDESVMREGYFKSRRGIECGLFTGDAVKSHVLWGSSEESDVSGKPPPES